MFFWILVDTSLAHEGIIPAEFQLINCGYMKIKPQKSQKTGGFWWISYTKIPEPELATHFLRVFLWIANKNIIYEEFDGLLGSKQSSHCVKWLSFKSPKSCCSLSRARWSLWIPWQTPLLLTSVRFKVKKTSKKTGRHKQSGDSLWVFVKKTSRKIYGEHTVNINVTNHECHTGANKRTMSRNTQQKNNTPKKKSQCSSGKRWNSFSISDAPCISKPHERGNLWRAISFITPWVNESLILEPKRWWCVKRLAASPWTSLLARDELRCHHTSYGPIL